MKAVFFFIRSDDGMADVEDSKSSEGNFVWVQVPFWAPLNYSYIAPFIWVVFLYTNLFNL